MTMGDTEESVRGIFALPNEILLNIFDHFETPEVLPLSLTCHHFYSLTLLLLCDRLQTAASLDGHQLYLECGPPAAKWTTSKVFCDPLGTDGILALASDIHDARKRIGSIGRMDRIYSRFRPVDKEPDHSTKTRPRPHPAGDIPGSRTWIPLDEREPAAVEDEDDAVTQTVTVDAQCLFSQLETLAYLGKSERMRGVLLSIEKVCDGTIRVWRDWLSRQCERKRWSDGAPIAIHYDARVGGSSNSKAATVGAPSVADDPSILWINTSQEKVGVKFRVKEQKWRRENPVLFASDVEVPVSYKVELEEILVRTTHLLLTLEKARRQIDNKHGKVIVFGSYFEQMT